MVPVNGIFKALGMDEIQISSGRVMGNYKGDMIELYSDGRFFVGEAKVGNISNIRSVNNIIYAPIELLMEKLGYEVTFKESEIDIVKAKSDHIQYNKLQSLMYKRLSVEQKQEELLLISKMLDDNAYSKINRTKLEKLRSSSLEEVKKEISTIYDLVTYLKLKEFSMDSGVLGEQQIKDNARKMTYHYNFSAEEVFKNNVANCGGIANLVKYILGDNYEELGYVHTADGSGGHVINYFFKDGYYYLVDFTDFIDDSGDGMFRGRYKNMQDIVNEYGKGQELVYYYSNYEYQIPSGHAYDSSDLSRYIPKGYEVYILKENKATGHVIKYADGFPNTILPKKMNKNN